MLSRSEISEAVQEFLEYSMHDSERIRHEQYEIYQWADDGRMSSALTVSIPSVIGWSQTPLEGLDKTETLIKKLVSDEDIPLIDSRSGATKAFSNLIREIRIESNRGGTDELRNDPDFYDAIHSRDVIIEQIAPILGLEFEVPVRLTQNLKIRHLSDFEKEIILNATQLGGGSVALQRAIKAGTLTHGAVFNNSTTTENGWEGGISLFAEIGEEFRDEFDDLKIALRLFCTEGFQMSVQHWLDRTFYPTVISAQESHGASAYNSFADPTSVSDTEQLVKYYRLVSEMSEDEGIRVATNRLESSYRKVSNADGVVDAVIGIEAALSSGRSGAFREVRRRAAVLCGEKATYSELGRFQNLRNATVHGEETQVDSTDLNQVRALLTTILRRIIQTTIERDIPREEMIEQMDAAITKSIEDKFDELVSEFEST